MKPLVIIDTDVLIDAGREALDAMTCLKLLEDNACPAVSVVTQMELMTGALNETFSCHHREGSGKLLCLLS